MFHATARRRILVALLAGADTGLALVACRAARRGTVYVHLDRMEDAGLVVSHVPMLHVRRRYDLTPAGERAARRLIINRCPDAVL